MLRTGLEKLEMHNTLITAKGTRGFVSVLVQLSRLTALNHTHLPHVEAGQHAMHGAFRASTVLRMLGRSECVFSRKQHTAADTVLSCASAAGGWLLDSQRPQLAASSKPADPWDACRLVLLARRLSQLHAAQRPDLCLPGPEPRPSLLSPTLDLQSCGLEHVPVGVELLTHLTALDVSDNALERLPTALLCAMPGEFAATRPPSQIARRLLP